MKGGRIGGSGFLVAFATIRVPNAVFVSFGGVSFRTFSDPNEGMIKWSDRLRVVAIGVVHHAIVEPVFMLGHSTATTLRITDALRPRGA